MRSMHSSLLRGCLWGCSLLQQLRDLKGEAARGQFEPILSDLLYAIIQSVSILDDQIHRALIHEIMDLSVWRNSKAGFLPCRLAPTASSPDLQYPLDSE